jgi:NADH-quinone oxidoreductase subunit E
MTATTDMLVAYWPVAALAAVLLLVLVLPVRSLMRRTATPGPVAAPPPPPAPPPTPVQRLAASLDQAARERAQAARIPVTVVTVPPPPRASAWVARDEPTPPPPRGHKAFGRPQGLPAPRPEGRDDLKAIHGIGPRIERGLNALGIFHYDQIAAWDRRTVVWVETWFSLRGCIVRERWVDQAKALTPHPKVHRSVRV